MLAIASRTERLAGFALPDHAEQGPASGKDMRFWLGRRTSTDRRSVRAFGIGYFVRSRCTER